MKYMEVGIKIPIDLFYEVTELSSDEGRVLAVGYDVELGWIYREVDDPILERMTYVTMIDGDGVIVDTDYQ